MDSELKMSAMIMETMPLSEEEARVVDDCIPIRTFEKGTILLHEGKVAVESYQTIKGCVRQYCLVDGDEKTTAFYTEGQSISPLSGHRQKDPSKYYLSCVEDCILAVFHQEKELELYRQVPKLESLCRVSMEDNYARQQEVLAGYITTNPEERYLQLLQNRPELLQRIPQYHLASYLGVTPESLSRIRKRVANKRTGA